MNITQKFLVLVSIIILADSITIAGVAERLNTYAKVLRSTATSEERDAAQKTIGKDSAIAAGVGATIMCGGVLVWKFGSSLSAKWRNKKDDGSSSDSDDSDSEGDITSEKAWNTIKKYDVRELCISIADPSITLYVQKQAYLIAVESSGENDKIYDFAKGFFEKAKQEKKAVVIHFLTGDTYCEYTVQHPYGTILWSRPSYLESIKTNEQTNNENPQNSDEEEGSFATAQEAWNTFKDIDEGLNIYAKVAETKIAVDIRENAFFIKILNQDRVSQSIHDLAFQFVEKAKLLNKAVIIQYDKYDETKGSTVTWYQRFPDNRHVGWEIGTDLDQMLPNNT